MSGKVFGCEREHANMYQLADWKYTERQETGEESMHLVVETLLNGMEDKKKAYNCYLHSLLPYKNTNIHKYRSRD